MYKFVKIKNFYKKILDNLFEKRLGLKYFTNNLEMFMNYIVIIKILISGIILFKSYLAFSKPKYDLEYFFSQSSKRSKLIKSTDEKILQTEYKVNQNYAAFVPNLSLNSNYIRQEEPDNVFMRQQSPTEQTTIKLSLSQNLFRGFQDYNNLTINKIQRNVFLLNKEVDIVNLYLDVLNYYYQINSYYYTIENYKKEINIEEMRKEDLLRKKKLGRTRMSDIISIDASISDLNAKLLAIKIQLDTALEYFLYLTGEKNLNNIIEKENIVLSALEPLEKLLKKFLEYPAIKQAAEDYNIASNNVNNLRNKYFPSIDLSANYYFLRPDIYSGMKWDVMFTFSLPIDINLLLYNQLLEGQSKKKESLINYTDSKNLYIENVTKMYASYTAKIAQIKMLELSFNLYKENYLILLKEQQQGIATNSDVLLAMQKVNEVKISLDQNRYSAIIDLKTIKALTNSKNIIELYNAHN